MSTTRLEGRLGGRRSVVIGLDIGTTSAKAVAFDASGTPVASAQQPYGLYTSPSGAAEQDPALVGGAAARPDRGRARDREAHRPDHERSSRYDTLVEIYRELCDRLEPLFTTLRRLRDQDQEP